MALSIGGVSAKFIADTKGFVDNVNNAEKAVSSFVNKSEKAVKDVGKSFSDFGDGLKKIGGKISLFVTAPLVGAFGLVSKAAIDQVSQVQGATISLRAYEKDATKVTKVLSELVAFAQSDMGVLFQRQDLFDAAANLKVYGQETDGLVDKVKILSKGVAIGKTTFQELSSILGKVAQAGQMTGTDLQVLADRGIKLDDSFKNTTFTAEELFEAIDKALPDAVLEGRAQTIEGQMTRLNSAFRNLGGRILGVNDEVDGFLPGSLGERIFRTIEDIRQFLRSEEVINAVTQAGERLGQVFDIVSEKVESLWSWFISLSDENKKLIIDFVLVVAALGPILVVIGGIIGVVGGAISSFGFLFVIFNKILWVVGFVIGVFTALNPIVLLVVGVVGGLVAIGVALWKNWEKITGAFNTAKDAIGGFFRALSNIRAPKALTDLIDKLNSIKNLKLPGGLKIPGFATGVRNFGGGFAEINERGPEAIGIGDLVYLPKGADVFTNSETKDMMRGSGSNITNNFTVNNLADAEYLSRRLALQLRTN
jgi:hypothetical protein